MIGLISLQSKGLSRVSSNTTVQKHQFFGAQIFFMVQLSHAHMTTGKTKTLTRQTFVSKVMSLLFNMLSRLVILFLSRSQHLFKFAFKIYSDFGVQENKVCHCFHCLPIYLPWSDGNRFQDVSFSLSRLGLKETFAFLFGDQSKEAVVTF